MSLTRLTADLVRPVPVGRRLRIVPTIIREGKKLQVVDFVVTSDDAEHIRARALRVRDADLRRSSTCRRHRSPGTRRRRCPPETLEGDDRCRRGSTVPAVGHGLRRCASGRCSRLLGIWLRLRVPVVEEAIRATSRATVPMISST
ncbi:MAG: hypothetical protein R2695_13040 [Acidimicrobiales bacterium]